MGGRSECRTPSGGGGSSGCFPAGAMVKTTDGPRDISSLKKGDWVVSYDWRHHTEVRQPVLKLVRKRNSVWVIAFADGYRIRTTASHSLRVNGAWKTVGSVKPGDRVHCVDEAGKEISREVAGSAQSGEMEDVFNIVVRGNFTFIVDGVLAHSFTRFRLLRVLGWNAYAAFCDVCCWAMGIARRQPAMRAEPCPQATA